MFWYKCTSSHLYSTRCTSQHSVTPTTSALATRTTTVQRTNVHYHTCTTHDVHLNILSLQPRQDQLLELCLIVQHANVHLHIHNILHTPNNLQHTRYITHVRHSAAPAASSPAARTTTVQPTRVHHTRTTVCQCSHVSESCSSNNSIAYKYTSHKYNTRYRSHTYNILPLQPPGRGQLLEPQRNGLQIGHDEQHTCSTRLYNMHCFWCLSYVSARCLS